MDTMDTIQDVIIYRFSKKSDLEQLLRSNKKPVREDVINALLEKWVRYKVKDINFCVEVKSDNSDKDWFTYTYDVEGVYKWCNKNVVLYKPKLNNIVELI